MAKRRSNRPRRPLDNRLGPTPERRGHRGGVEVDCSDLGSDATVIGKRYRAVSECVLDAYFIRGKLTDAQHEAGMRYRQAYLRTYMHVTTGSGLPSSYADHDLRMVMALTSARYLREADQALRPVQRKMVVAVCGDDLWAGDTAHLRTLRRGLDVLCRLWHFV